MQISALKSLKYYRYFLQHKIQKNKNKMEATVAIKNDVRQSRIYEIRSSYLKPNYLNVSAATYLPERNWFQLQHWRSPTQSAFLGRLQRADQRQVDKHKVTPLFLCTGFLHLHVLVCWEKNHTKPFQVRLSLCRQITVLCLQGLCGYNGVCASAVDPDHHTRSDPSQKPFDTTPTALQ